MGRSAGWMWASTGRATDEVAGLRVRQDVGRGLARARRGLASEDAGIVAGAHRPPAASDSNKLIGHGWIQSPYRMLTPPWLAGSTRTSSARPASRHCESQMGAETRR